MSIETGDARVTSGITSSLLPPISGRDNVLIGSSTTISTGETQSSDKDYHKNNKSSNKTSNGFRAEAMIGGGRSRRR